MNKKGFVLMETLVVTIFTMFIFTILYNSVVPLIGKYNELAYYDDLDITYDLYHVRKVLRKDPNYSTIMESDYTIINCTNDTLSDLDSCNNLFSFLELDTSSELLFINKEYDLDLLQNESSLSVDVRNYLKYITTEDDILLLQKDGYVSYINTYPLDPDPPNITISIASSTKGNNNWYSAISIKGVAEDLVSEVVSISSCITTEDTCTPDNTATTYTKTVEIANSDTLGRRVCFTALDSAGNESLPVCSDLYLVDKMAPSVTNVSDAGGGKITFTAEDNHSGVYQYCLNTNSTSTTGCSWKSAISGEQTSEYATSSNTYYVHIRDNALNIGHSTTSVKIDVTLNAADAIIDTYGTISGLVAVNTSGTLYTGTGTIREYRYAGPSVNNYIVFNNDGDGTYEINELWRIVGVFKDTSGAWQLKLMRNQVLSLDEVKDYQTTSYSEETYPVVSWQSETEYYGVEYNNIWSDSGLQYFLNNTTTKSGDGVGYYSYFTTKAKALIDTNVSYKISEISLDHSGAINNTIDLYEEERASSYMGAYNVSTWTGAIGLLNSSDYGYSHTSTYWTEILNTHIDFETTSWMHTTANHNYQEWFINKVTNSSYTANGDTHAAIWNASYHIDDSNWSSISAGVSDSDARYQNVVMARPVLHLLSDVKIKSIGDGSESNPYVIVE